MHKYFNTFLKSALPIVLVTILLGCSAEKSRSPLSPSIAGPIQGIGISAPSPVSPLNGFLIKAADQPIQLTFEPATSNSERPFWYELQVATDSEFSHVVFADYQVPATTGPTQAYQLPNILPTEQTYHWRVRAVAGANTGPFSAPMVFDVYTPLSVGTPEPTSPVGSTVTESREATLVVSNASITGPVSAISYRFEVASDSGFAIIAVVLNVASGDATTVANTGDLDWVTNYYWRAQAVAEGREGQVVGPWSVVATFQTPEAPPQPPAPEPSCCPPPNRFEVVQQVAAETGYPSSGIDVTDFTQVVAERLAQEDSNWGRRINITGPIGKDTVAYRVDDQDDNPFSIDIVLGATGSNPSIHWSPHGRIGGTWIPVN